MAVVIFAFMCSPQTGYAETKPLRMGTLDLTPYGWVAADGSKHGLVYRLHEEIGKRSGLQYTNDIIPLARAFIMLKNGDLDLITAQAHNAALDAGAPLIVQNLIRVVAVTKKNSGMARLSDLKGKHLLYIIGTSYPPLEGIPGNISRTPNYHTMLKMVYSRPLIDGGIFSEPAYYYWLQQTSMTANDFGKPIPVATRKDWVFVRKDLPAHLREKIVKAVESMREDNFYENMLKELAVKSPLKQF
ncbi:substrate-binding periplasmic protein [Maridesulfovibrio sp. FT414]|uniref:substrate-binding periplasmic protein n=1 Tax=Maridesulfovibrio sp. FT414 TaxID=2979469 RepID=UPI003D80363E